MQVRLQDESIYGIFVRNIIAKGSFNSSREARTLDSTDSTSLTLIDKTGCPGESRMMREVRTLGETSKSLESAFEAFSFYGSNQIELLAEVETCLDRCRPVYCKIRRGESWSLTSPSSKRSEDDDGQYETVLSYGRKRRRRFVDPSDAVKGDVLRVETIGRKITITASDSKNRIKSTNIIRENEESNLIPISLFLSSSNGSLVSDNKTTNGPLNKRRTPPIKIQRTQQIMSRGRNFMQTLSSSTLSSILDEDAENGNKNGLLCFDSLTILTVVGVSLFVQIIMMSASFVFISRRYKSMYGNSNNGSTASLFTLPSSHKHSLCHLNEPLSRQSQEYRFSHNQRLDQPLRNFFQLNNQPPSPSSINISTQQTNCHQQRQYYHHRSSVK